LLSLVAGVVVLPDQAAAVQAAIDVQYQVNHQAAVQLPNQVSMFFLTLIT
jgi:hypothetical protein